MVVFGYLKKQHLKVSDDQPKEEQKFQIALAGNSISTLTLSDQIEISILLLFFMMLVTFSFMGMLKRPIRFLKIVYQTERVHI